MDVQVEAEHKDEGTKRFLSWSFTGSETIYVCSMAVGIALWATSNFQTKTDAKSQLTAIEKRVETVEADSKAMRSSVEAVAVDVSYIRGRLEPKPNNGK